MLTAFRGFSRENPSRRTHVLPTGSVRSASRLGASSHDALEMLLKAGADPNVSYGNSMSPLRRAAFYDDTESCRLLLGHGAVPSDAAVNAAAWRNRDP